MAVPARWRAAGTAGEIEACSAVSRGTFAGGGWAAQFFLDRRLPGKLSGREPVEAQQPNVRPSCPFRERSAELA